MREPSALWFLLLAGLLLSACNSSCGSLSRLACERHGEDSRQCIQAEAKLSETSLQKGRLCDRALMLYQSLKSE